MLKGLFKVAARTRGDQLSRWFGRLPKEERILSMARETTRVDVLQMRTFARGKHIRGCKNLHNVGSWGAKARG